MGNDEEGASEEAPGAMLISRILDPDLVNDPEMLFRPLGPDELKSSVGSPGSSGAKCDPFAASSEPSHADTDNESNWEDDFSRYSMRSPLPPRQTQRPAKPRSKPVVRKKLTEAQKAERRRRLEERKDLLCWEKLYHSQWNQAITAVAAEDWDFQGRCDREDRNCLDLWKTICSTPGVKKASILKARKAIESLQPQLVERLDGVLETSNEKGGKKSVGGGARKRGAKANENSDQKNDGGKSSDSDRKQDGGEASGRGSGSGDQHGGSSGASGSGSPSGGSDGNGEDDKSKKNGKSGDDDKKTGGKKKDQPEPKKKGGKKQQQQEANWVKVQECIEAVATGKVSLVSPEGASAIPGSAGSGDSGKTAGKSGSRKKKPAKSDDGVTVAERTAILRAIVQKTANDPKPQPKSKSKLIPTKIPKDQLELAKMINADLLAKEYGPAGPPKKAAPVPRAKKAPAGGKSSLVDTLVFARKSAPSPFVASTEAFMMTGIGGGLFPGIGRISFGDSRGSACLAPGCLSIRPELDCVASTSAAPGPSGASAPKPPPNSKEGEESATEEAPPEEEPVEVQHEERTEQDQETEEDATEGKPDDKKADDKPEEKPQEQEQQPDEPKEAEKPLPKPVKAKDNSDSESDNDWLTDTRPLAERLKEQMEKNKQYISPSVWTGLAVPLSLRCSDPPPVEETLTVETAQAIEEAPPNGGPLHLDASQGALPPEEPLVVSEVEEPTKKGAPKRKPRQGVGKKTPATAEKPLSDPESSEPPKKKKRAPRKKAVPKEDQTVKPEEPKEPKKPKKRAPRKKPPAIGAESTPTEEVTPKKRAQRKPGNKKGASKPEPEPVAETSSPEVESNAEDLEPEKRDQVAGGSDALGDEIARPPKGRSPHKLFVAATEEEEQDITNDEHVTPEETYQEGIGVPEPSYPEPSAFDQEQPDESEKLTSKRVRPGPCETYDKQMVADKLKNRRNQNDPQSTQLRFQSRPISVPLQSMLSGVMECLARVNVIQTKRADMLLHGPPPGSDSDGSASDERPTRAKRRRRARSAIRVDHWPIEESRRLLPPKKRHKSHAPDGSRRGTSGANRREGDVGTLSDGLPLLNSDGSLADEESDQRSSDGSLSDAALNVDNFKHRRNCCFADDDDDDAPMRTCYNLMEHFQKILLHGPKEGAKAEAIFEYLARTMPRTTVRKFVQILGGPGKLKQYEKAVFSGSVEGAELWGCIVRRSSKRKCAGCGASRARPPAPKGENCLVNVKVERKEEAEELSKPAPIGHQSVSSSSVVKQEFRDHPGSLSTSETPDVGSIEQQMDEDLSEHSPVVEEPHNGGAGEERVETPAQPDASFADRVAGNRPPAPSTLAGPSNANTRASSSNEDGIRGSKRPSAGGSGEDGRDRPAGNAGVLASAPPPPPQQQPPPPQQQPPPSPRLNAPPPPPPRSSHGGSGVRSDGPQMNWPIDPVTGACVREMVSQHLSTFARLFQADAPPPAFIFQPASQPEQRQQQLNELMGNPNDLLPLLLMSGGPLGLPPPENSRSGSTPLLLLPSQGEQRTTRSNPSSGNVQQPPPQQRQQQPAARPNQTPRNGLLPHHPVARPSQLSFSFRLQHPAASGPNQPPGNAPLQQQSRRQATQPSGNAPSQQQPVVRANQGLGNVQTQQQPVAMSGQSVVDVGTPQQQSGTSPGLLSGNGQLISPNPALGSAQRMPLQRQQQPGPQPNQPAGISPLQQGQQPLVARANQPSATSHPQQPAAGANQVSGNAQHLPPQHQQNLPVIRSNQSVGNVQPQQLATGTNQLLVYVQPSPAQRRCEQPTVAGNLCSSVQLQQEDQLVTRSDQPLATGQPPLPEQEQAVRNSSPGGNRPLPPLRPIDAVGANSGGVGGRLVQQIPLADGSLAMAAAAAGDASEHRVLGGDSSGVLEPHVQEDSGQEGIQQQAQDDSARPDGLHQGGDNPDSPGEPPVDLYYHQKVHAFATTLARFRRMGQNGEELSSEEGSADLPLENADEVMPEAHPEAESGDPSIAEDLSVPRATEGSVEEDVLGRSAETPVHPEDLSTTIRAPNHIFRGQNEASSQLGATLSENQVHAHQATPVVPPSFHGHGHLPSPVNQGHFDSPGAATGTSQASYNNQGPAQFGGQEAALATSQDPRSQQGPAPIVAENVIHESPTEGAENHVPNQDAEPRLTQNSSRQQDPPQNPPRRQNPPQEGRGNRQIAEELLANFNAHVVNRTGNGEFLSSARASFLEHRHNLGRNVTPDEAERLRVFEFLFNRAMGPEMRLSPGLAQTRPDAAGIFGAPEVLADQPMPSNHGLGNNRRSGVPLISQPGGSQPPPQQQIPPQDQPVARNERDPSGMLGVLESLADQLVPPNVAHGISVRSDVPLASQPRGPLLSQPSPPRDPPVANNRPLPTGMFGILETLAGQFMPSNVARGNSRRSDVPLISQQPGGLQPLQQTSPQDQPVVAHRIEERRPYVEAAPDNLQNGAHDHGHAHAHAYGVHGDASNSRSASGSDNYGDDQWEEYLVPDQQQHRPMSYYYRSEAIQQESYGFPPYDHWYGYGNYAPPMALQPPAAALASAAPAFRQPVAPMRAPLFPPAPAPPPAPASFYPPTPGQYGMHDPAHGYPAPMMHPGSRIWPTPPVVPTMPGMRPVFRRHPPDCEQSCCRPDLWVRVDRGNQ